MSLLSLNRLRPSICILRTLSELLHAQLLLLRSRSVLRTQDSGRLNAGADMEGTAVSVLDSGSDFLDKLKLMGKNQVRVENRDQEQAKEQRQSPETNSK